MSKNKNTTKETTTKLPMSKNAGKTPTTKTPTNKTEMKLNPYGQFFTDPDGQMTIEMAWFEEKNEYGLHDALVKVTGRAAHTEGIDQQTYLYTTYPAGTGINFGYTQGGQERTRMLTRSNWGSWKFFELFVNGEKFNVYPDEKRSKEVKPLHLYTEYKNQSKKSA